MASLEQRNGIYRVVFRFAGQKYSRSLKTRNDKAATASLARLEDNLRRIELGTLDVPSDADVASFLLSDGKVTGRPKRPTVATVDEVFQAFLASLPGDAIEASTLSMTCIHLRHLKRLLGSRMRVQKLQLSDLQRYVDERSKENGIRGNSVCATTIKKEIVTLASVWKWSERMGFVERGLPRDGLRYPKTTEKPPFQTWDDIERKIGRGGLTKAQEAELWDCLFLKLEEIEELLKYVGEHARHLFIYPMFSFAAHTGARRSELMRSQIDDIDLEAKTAIIREKKRVKGKLTTRSVPLSPFLADVMRHWLSQHPGGNYTFCLESSISRSRKSRSAGEPLTRDEAHDHFKTTLAADKWEKLRGWHVFRHSFCSNCAAVGIDQRIINAWVGHQTEEMVRRYRHLIPNQEQAAIRQVFGKEQLA